MIQFEMLWSAADAAGRKAAAECTPRPMVVTQHGSETGGVRVVDIIDDGMCGFAYVKIRPANGPFVKWLKTRNVGYKAYGGGWEVSIHDYGQSWERKRAHARAMATVLRDAGINATSYDRLD